MITPFLNQIQTFPTLPSIVARIIRITSDPDSTPDELTRLIETDSSLAVEVLKWANFPLFGRRRNVSTIDDAVEVLGLTEIKNLALAKTMFQTFRSAKGFDAYSLWRHSYYCGSAAEVLAELLPQPVDLAEYFAAGLIHDIGKMIIFLQLGEDNVKALDYHKPFNPNIIHKEKAILGIGHDKLGMQLLNSWLFPPRLIAAVGYHHSLDEVCDHHPFPFIIHLADILSYIYEAVSSGDTENGNALSGLLLSPHIRELALIEGIELNLVRIELFLEKMKIKISLQSEIIALLSGKEENRIDF